MGNQHKQNELELSRFGEYLLKSRIVQEKYASYYVRWVRRFMVQIPSKPGLTIEDRISVFLENLQTSVEPWQLDQAGKAIRLYFSHYLPLAATEIVTTEVTPDSQGNIRKIDVMDATRRLIQLRHYSHTTEQTYLGWIGRYFSYLTSVQRPALEGSFKVTPQSVTDYLAYLAINRRVSSTTQNQAFNALLFMCREVLRMDLGDISHNVRAKHGRRLPVVLSVEEVKAIFSHMTGTPKLMAALIYGGGLRVMECCQLRVKDLDFSNNLIIVRQGKGDEDRSTILAGSIKPALTAHLERVKALHEQDLAKGYGEVAMPGALAIKYPKAGKEWCWQYVFPSRALSVDRMDGKVRRFHATDTSIQAALHKAVRAAGINKPASVHTLRHSFATTLLLNGVDIRQIQTYLGHKKVETTMIYTHVVKDMRNPATSPLDLLGS
jgi:integron integrase